MLGDKGFDSDEIRGAILEEHDALPVIPNRSNRREPWPWDDEMKETYKERNRVERHSARRSSSADSRPATRSSGRCSSAGATGVRIHPRQKDRPIRQHALGSVGKVVFSLQVVDLAGADQGKGSSRRRFSSAWCGWSSASFTSAASLDHESSTRPRRRNRRR